jgi:hypothetical protein
MTPVIAETGFMINNGRASMGALVWSVCGVDVSLSLFASFSPSFLWLRPYLDPTNTAKPSVTHKFRGPIELKDSGFLVFSAQAE